MDWKQIREEYEQSTITLKELAVKHGVSEGTMRSRKNREKWQRNATEDATQRDRQRATREKNVATRNTASKREPRIKVIEIDENLELTEKQRLFCSYYVKYRNKTKAYMKAYKCSYDNADAHAYELWENVGVRNEINKRLKELRDNINLEAQDLIQKYIDIAFSDITDYVEFGQEEVPVMGAFGPVEIENPETGKKEPLTQMINVIKFKQSTEIDGTIIREVKQGRNGASVKLEDKMKAMDWLGKHSGLLDDETKLKLDINKERLKIEQAKFEIEKKKNFDDPEETYDDGFVEALKADVSNVWAGDQDD